jgi:GNAT superfamily N-acetyltransferase
VHPFPAELQLKRLRSSDEAEFLALADVYQLAFPESERKPLPVLRAMLADVRYHFLHSTCGGKLAGFAVVRRLSSSTAALLEYLAVAPAQRGRGLGRQLFVKVAEAVKSPPATLLIEAESDRVECPDRELRAKRKSFYRSLGARELHGLSWIMPQVSSTAPPAMEMLALGATESTVSKEQLRHWLADIYVEVYGQSADDARIGTMVSDLPDVIALL